MCGELRFQTKDKLRSICACHCIECRKSSGHYSAATSVSTDSLEITGDSLKWFKSSNIAERGFCDKCGSNLFYRPINENRTSIFCGSFDSSTGLKIDSQIYVEEMADYYVLPNVKIIRQCDLAD